MSVTNVNTSIENDHLILYKVSLRGDVPAFEELLQEDELILDRVVITSFNETPLHIAAMRGHLHLARALLSRKPKLADELDSFRRLPLHLASAEGYTDIVKELLKASPDACFARDEDGRIPLHLAAMNERVEIMKELLRVSPESIREKVDYGETILHLCVKYNRLEALKLLIERARDEEFINASDVNGNTILHLAAILKQVKTTKYLLSETSIRANARNRNGFAALDALDHSPKDLQGLEIKIILLEAGVQRALNPIDPLPSTESKLPKAGVQRALNPIDPLRANEFELLEAGVQRPVNPTNPLPPTESGARFIITFCKFWNRYIERAGKRLEEARGNTLVAATVTASMAYQAGINPPQRDSKIDASPAPSDIPGTTVDNKGGFWVCNTLSFMFSLIIIMLMISGVPIGKKFARVFLVIAMCTTVLFISKAYSFALNLQSEDAIGDSWILIPFLFFLILVVHCATFLITLLTKIVTCILNQFK